MLLPYRWCGAAAVAWLIWVLNRRGLDLRGGRRGAAFLTWVWPVIIVAAVIAVGLAPVIALARRSST